MGIAYLPDGRTMDYEEYLKTQEWKLKKADRLAFDNFSCGICHTGLDADCYETHHLNYSRLGNEDVEHDLISICHECHVAFHNGWNRTEYWRQTPYQHWKDYSLDHTARFCLENIKNDYFFGGQLNMCSRDNISDQLNEYFKTLGGPLDYRIDIEDVLLCFRNFRYQMLLDNLESVKTITAMEVWLDEKFGKKGCKGGNKKRANARSFITKHKPATWKRCLKENENITALMDAVEKLKG